MKLENRRKDKHRLAYLASLHGHTANEELGRTFPRLKNPRVYQEWSDSHKNESEIDLNGREFDIYVSSDHHFGHTNIIKYANRPFKDARSMNEYMIERHNERVGTADIAMLIGDIAFCDTKTANKYLARMNGYKILIIGNHDWEHKKNTIKDLDVDEMHVSYYLEVPYSNDIEDFGYQGCIFTHAPFDSLHVERNNLINFHGHIHQNGCGLLRYQNMCVEWIEYAPRQLDELVHQYRIDKFKDDK